MSIIKKFICAITQHPKLRWEVNPTNQNTEPLCLACNQYVRDYLHIPLKNFRYSPHSPSSSPDFGQGYFFTSSHPPWRRCQLFLTIPRSCTQSLSQPISKIASKRLDNCIYLWYH